MDPWLRGPCCIVTVFGYKSEARTSNLQTEMAVERLQHHRPLFRGGGHGPLDPPVSVIKNELKASLVDLNTRQLKEDNGRTKT